MTNRKGLTVEKLTKSNTKTTFENIFDDVVLNGIKSDIETAQKHKTALDLTLAKKAIEGFIRIGSYLESISNYQKDTIKPMKVVQRDYKGVRYDLTKKGDFWEYLNKSGVLNFGGIQAQKYIRCYLAKDRLIELMSNLDEIVLKQANLHNLNIMSKFCTFVTKSDEADMQKAIEDGDKDVKKSDVIAPIDVIVDSFNETNTTSKKPENYRFSVTLKKSDGSNDDKRKIHITASKNYFKSKKDVAIALMNYLISDMPDEIDTKLLDNLVVHEDAEIIS